MLSESATKLVMNLCNKISGKEYVIYSWEEVKNCYGEDVALEDVKSIFEEARLNLCITQKYKDADEVCFSMTDKALLIKQDYELMLKAEKTQQKVIKTDEAGNSVIVLPKTSKEVVAQTKKPLSFKITAFLYGILGGVLGGGIICGIMYLVQALGA
ncbi:MAG: hypothetical protein E7338_05860 [Clostridiales bacterium]|nr:hypothetical protein [Clostridiales bacterium]